MGPPLSNLSSRALIGKIGFLSRNYFNRIKNPIPFVCVSSPMQRNSLCTRPYEEREITGTPQVLALSTYAICPCAFDVSH
jgi:hypothetical protein